MLKKLLLLVAAIISVGSQGKADIILGGTSYVQNFNSLGSGLPTGVTVRTGATATSLGTVAGFVSTVQSATSPAASSTNWNITSGRFFNAASATAGASATAAVQAAAADRALAVRLVAGSDPGNAFVFRFTNTSGFTNFDLTFDAQTLDAQPRTSTWRVDYGFGATPASFTAVGSTFTDTAAFGSTNRSFDFGTALDNNAGPVWLRITNLTASSGSGNRDTFGIDNFNLTYSAVPEPTSMALVGMFSLAGLVVRFRRRKSTSAAV